MPLATIWSLPQKAIVAKGRVAAREHRSAAYPYPARGYGWTMSVISESATLARFCRTSRGVRRPGGIHVGEFRGQ